MNGVERETEVINGVPVVRFTLTRDFWEGAVNAQGVIAEVLKERINKILSFPCNFTGVRVVVRGTTRNPMTDRDE